MRRTDNPDIGRPSLIAVKPLPGRAATWALRADTLIRVSLSSADLGGTLVLSSRNDQMDHRPIQRDDGRDGQEPENSEDRFVNPGEVSTDHVPAEIRASSG